MDNYNTQDMIKELLSQPNQTLDNKFEIAYQDYQNHQKSNKTSSGDKSVQLNMINENNSIKSKQNNNSFGQSGLSGLMKSSKPQTQKTKDYIVYYEDIKTNMKLQCNLKLSDDTKIMKLIQIAVQYFSQNVEDNSQLTNKSFKMYMANSKGKAKTDYGCLDDQQVISQTNVTTFCLIGIQLEPIPELLSQQTLNNPISKNQPLTKQTQQQNQSNSKSFFKKYICFCL